MMHETESGLFGSRNESGGGAIVNPIDNSININGPMPWIFLSLLIGTLGLGLAIGALVIQPISAKEAHDLAWNAQTQCELYKSHVNDLEHTMAAHGILQEPKK